MGLCRVAASSTRGYLASARYHFRGIGELRALRERRGGAPREGRRGALRSETRRPQPRLLTPARGARRLLTSLLPLWRRVRTFAPEWIGNAPRRGGSPSDIDARRHVRLVGSRRRA